MAAFCVYCYYLTHQLRTRSSIVIKIHYWSFLHVFLVFIIAAQQFANGNPEVIKDMARKDTIFTGIIISYGKKKLLVIDRIIKGSVNPFIIISAQITVDLDMPVGTRYLHTAEKNGGRLFTSVLIENGSFRHVIDGKIVKCELKKLIDDVSEIPGFDQRK